MKYFYSTKVKQFLVLFLSVERKFQQQIKLNEICVA